MMKEKKNIDQLFQEKFQDFHPQPSDKVWENIALTKAEKEDRKAIPLWWKLGGIAAVLALLFTAGTFLYDGNENTSNEVVTTQEAQQSEAQEGTNQNALETSTTKESQVVNVEEVEENQVDNGNGKDEEETVTNQTKIPFISKSGAQQLIASQSNQKDQKNTTIASDDKRYKAPSNSISEEKETVAVTKDVSNTKQEDPNAREEELVNPLIKEGKEITNAKIKEAVASEEDNKATDGDNGKSLIEEAKRIEAQKAEEAMANVEENDAYNRWGVAAVAAPVYYGDFGGSGVDTEFEGNNRSGNINVSYGVQVSYNVSPKLKVRTGVSNVDLSYNTQNVGISPDISARQLKGIDYSRNARFVSVGKLPNASQELSAASNTSDIQGGGSRFTPGELEQRVGYVEVPLEAVYTLSDKRLGLEVIGGVSTLFLNDNEIALEADNGQRTPLGTSTGANDVSFSTNVGVGVYYKVTDKVQVKMEPSFKYQVNAFDKDVVDFKPYYMGLYTGVSYRF